MQPRSLLSYRFLPAASLVLVALFGTPPRAVLAANAALSFAPASSSIAAGANDAVDVTVANVTNMGGYDLSLSWNPAVVQLTTLADANIWAGHSNVVICDSPSINNAIGQATMGCATFQGFGYDPNGGVSTAGAMPLVHAVFKGTAPPSSSLDLSGSALQHPDATAITPVTLNTGSITVVASGPVGGVSLDPDRNAVRNANTRPNDSGSITQGTFWGGLSTLSLCAIAGAVWYRCRRRVR